MLSYPTRPVWQMSLPNSIKQIKQVLDVTQSVVIICAAIVGGFWAYFKYSTERSEYRVEFPHVLVEHRISHIVLDDGRYVLLFVGVDVKNTGSPRLIYEQPRYGFNKFCYSYPAHRACVVLQMR